jgi:iron complex transport system ATP-binding protein
VALQASIRGRIVTLLQATNLQFSYGERPVLRGVSVRLNAGEVVALLGPNGSGKSTLLRVLLGQLRAGSGDVLWDGRDVRDWSRRELARRVAYLPQSPTAEPDQTVLEVLRNGRAPYWGAFGVESSRDVQIVDQVARQLGLDGFVRRPIGQLSGGQRQSVFVGRCLVQEPAALLLDEPNTFLDLRHQVELSRLLKALARERALGVLMASHDLNLAGMIADRLVLLGEGVVAAEGSPDQVLLPDLLTTVYKTPLRRFDRKGSVVIQAMMD